MSLKTRLDGRSETNRSFQIRDKNNEVIAEVSLIGNSSCNLQISTKKDLYIEKPSGFKSRPILN